MKSFSTLPKSSFIIETSLGAKINFFKRIFAISCILISGLVGNIYAQSVLPGTAPVLVPSGGFAIEGDLQANSPIVGIGDWLAGAAGGGGFILDSAGHPLNSGTTFHLVDSVGNNDNSFSGGKSNDSPKSWTWGNGNANSKTDIQNVLVHFALDARGHQWVIVAGDRSSASGAMFMSFEFLQNTLTLNPNGKFNTLGPDSGRTVGDFSLTFSTGGNFMLEIWQASGSSFTYNTLAAPAGTVYGANNAANVPVSFGAFGSTTYQAGAFVEGAVDITALLGNFNPCIELGIKTIFVKTRTAPATSASLEDFVTPLQVTKLQFGVAIAGANQTKCSQGDSTSFTLAGDSASAPGDSVKTVTWNVISGSANISNPNSLTSLVKVSSGSAALRLTITTRGGCIAKDSLILTVNSLPTASISGPSSACNGIPATLTSSTNAVKPIYIWSPGGATTSSVTVTPPSTTTYSVTVTDSVTGCSATSAGKTLTINNSTTSSQSATACDSYIWNGATYTTGGDKTRLFTGGNSVGCDSTATLHLTLNFSSSGSESKTSCDSYAWNGATYTTSGDNTYLFAGGNSAGCDSIATLHLTLNYSSSGGESKTSCDSYAWNGATYTTSGDKTHLFVGGNSAAGGCDSLATLHLTINHSSSGSESKTACNSYAWNGATYTTSGDRTHLFAGGNSAGCDSAATLHLTVNYSSSGSESQTACNSYVWNGATYTTSGDKTHLFAGGNSVGCDSTATLHLTVNYSSSGSESQTACNSYAWNGATYTTSGDKTYLFADGNAVGCDSTATLHLTINHSSSSSFLVITCDSYDLPWDSTVSQSGDYKHTYKTINNCDSVVTAHITINNSAFTSFFATACDSYKLPWDSVVLQTGDYFHHYFTTKGCDSLVAAFITINYSSSGGESQTACNSYAWNGATYTTSGDKTHLFAGGNAADCDSTATLHLTINHSTSGGESQTACNSYAWNGATYTTSGDKTHLFAGGNAVGCDSTATLHLTINHSSSGSESQTACNSYTWNGATYTAGGDKTHLFAGGNAVGCDSTATLHLTINHSTSGSESKTSCDSYAWNGATYTAGGDKTHLFAGGNAAGCDSTATLHLTINHSTSGSESKTSCNSYAWNGSSYTTSGDKTHLFAGGNAVGCDSAATLHLTINHSTTGGESKTSCDSYIWNGSTYTSSGAKTHLFAGGNSAGCDSTATLNLTINHSSTSGTSQTACDSFAWNGTTYTSSTTVTDHFTNAQGCDSAATLNLTIHNSGTFSTSQTACDSYAWNGSTYTSSGTFTFHSTNASGCDLTQILNLTINNSSTSSSNQTACDSFIWNGTTYTSSTNSTKHFTNAVGCDSAATLHLTINKSSTSSSNQTACDSFAWNGTTYTSSTTATKHFTNAAGCDSAATLHLTIRSSSTSGTSQTACGSFAWNGTTYTASTTVTKHLVNAAGCDSAATLQLTINLSTSGSESSTACDSYIWNGSTYTTSGDKTHLFAAGGGRPCDSLATLHLTIRQSSAGSEARTACGSYAWNGTTYTSSGTKTHLFTKGNASGCDSTATLILTVNPSPSCSFPAIISPACSSAGDSLSITASGGTGAYTYAWSVSSSSGWIITSATNVNPIIYTVGPFGAGTFKVIVKDAVGCTSTCSDVLACTGPSESCGHGFWKNHVSIWRDAGSAIPTCIANAISSLGPPYSGNGTTNSSFASTFGLTSAQMTAAGLSPTLTLLQAEQIGGGGFINLARQGVCALLNGCSINYKYTSAQVIVIMHNAYVSLNPNPISPSFDLLNEAGPDQCPSAGRATKRLGGLLTGTDDVAVNSYPNPFSSSITIEFMLSNISSHTSVEIYNVAGQKVLTLFDGQADEGINYKVQFNGDDYAAGVYFAKITTDDGYTFDKLMLIK